MIARARLGRTLLLALCALCWLAFPVQASDESPANRLFVEAAKLIQVAEEEAGAARKLELLKRAKHKLETIVDRHPSSGLAVKLISGQKIGTVSLAGLDDEIEVAAVHACPQAPTLDCVLSTAVATAKMIEDAGSRTRAFAMIAAVQAKKSDGKQAGETFGIALETAKAIEDSDSRTGAFSSIAWAQIEAGYIAEAFTTAKTIEDASSLTWIFTEIAAAQTKKGDIKQAGETLGIALETTKAIKSTYDCSQRIPSIAATQAEAGYIAEAFTTAKTIEDAGSRARAFTMIAAAQAKKGDFKQAEETLGIALKTAKMIEGADSRTRPC